jgi:hypothetical protein
MILEKLYLTKQRKIAVFPNPIKLNFSLNLNSQQPRHLCLIPLRNYFLWVIVVIMASVVIQEIHNQPERLAKQEQINAYSRPAVYGLMARHCSTCH